MACHLASENRSWGVFAMRLHDAGLQPMALHSLSETALLLVPVNALSMYGIAFHYKRAVPIVKPPASTMGTNQEQ